MYIEIEVMENINRKNPILNTYNMYMYEYDVSVSLNTYHMYNVWCVSFLLSLI